MSDRDGWEISTERSRMDVDLIHRFLSEQSYWAHGIPREIVARSMEHSHCFAAFDRDGKQIAFARVITDYATFAYLADVFVVEAHRGKGVSKALMASILDDPKLQGLRRWLLATRDAHGLYAQFGFVPPAPNRLMERVTPDIYQKR